MEIWQNILDRLKRDQSLYLMVVVDHHGSTPGRTGFKMIVSEDGYINGSIGGGVMEYNLVEEARGLLKSGTERSFVKRQVHNRDKQDGSGMVCSGEQTVAFVSVTSKDLGVVENITKAQAENQTTQLRITSKGIQSSNDIKSKVGSYEYSESNYWQYYEEIGFKNSLYIIGGGHVGLAVSDLFVSMGFYVTVLDNRENLNTLAMNNSAHKKEIINFENIEEYIESKENVFVAVMTNRFIDDKTVISKLIGKNLHFLGVLGSKAKLKLMWDLFRNESVSESELSNISGPIGLDIKSQTPIEIAVSIAAEIIKMKK